MIAFAEYQDWHERWDDQAGRYAPNTDWYYALGLAGETGEVVDKIKKSYRTGDKYVPVDDKAIGLELGDALWYLTRLARNHGFTLADIASMNIEKLEDRHKRGALGGQGDDR